MCHYLTVYAEPAMAGSLIGLVAVCGSMLALGLAAIIVSDILDYLAERG